MPGGGDMMGGGGGAPGVGPVGVTMTPEDMMNQAEGLAQQLLQMPYENRRSHLHKIRKSSDTLHALVKAKLDDLRQEMRSSATQVPM
jgi:hypothetical protein